MTQMVTQTVNGNRYRRQPASTIPQPIQRPAFNDTWLAKAGEFIERQVEQAKPEQEREYWERMTPEALLRDQIEKCRREDDRWFRHLYWKRWERYDRIVEQRGKRYLGCRWANYETNTPEQLAVFNGLRVWCETLPTRIKHGENLILVGPCGTGKDHLLTCVVREAILLHDFRCEWTTGPELFKRWRNEFDGGTKLDPGDSQFAGRYGGLDSILCISDPVQPGGTLTQYQSERMYALVDKRWSQGVSTFLTVNASGRDDLEQRLGVAIVDRLADRATTFACNWPSYRKPLGKVS